MNIFSKRTRRVIPAALAALTVSLLGLSLWAADAKPKRATQAFMRQKLVWSQAILEGLTLEKFDVVSKNAIRMRDMTQNNLWSKIKLPAYLVATTNYQKQVDALYMAAVDKNLDAATEAYMRVTKSCVECHRLLRTGQHNVDSRSTTIP